MAPVAAPAHPIPRLAARAAPRGLLFENWVMTELLKAQTHRGIKPSLYFLRDKQGHEVDAVIETAPRRLHGVEIKSGETVSSDWFAGLDYWREQLPRGATLTPWLVYGGGTAQKREKAQVLPWAGLDPLLEQLHG